MGSSNLTSRGLGLATRFPLLPHHLPLDLDAAAAELGKLVPAAVVTMSPLFEIDNEARADHPNVRSDAMFPHKAFHALVELIEEAASKRVVDGEPEQIYEPLDHIEPGLPRTLIHVSGSEVLLSDARKAARLLAAAGVPVEIRIWPGQMHVFQLGAPAVSEATRSIRQIGEYIREATW